MIIRKYHKKDKAPLVELWEQAFPDDPPHNQPTKVIEQKLAVDDMILVAEEADTIIGACLIGYDGHRGWLYTVAVSSNHRRKKVGSSAQAASSS